MSINQTLDLGVIDRFLETFAAGPPRRQQWLEDSYSNPELFWSQLMATSAATHGSRARSVALAKYDFFFDALSRHGREKQHALVWFESTGERRGIRYAELRDASVLRAHAWRAQGLAVGQCIAIVDTHPLEIATSMLAALKLGLVFSLVPPTGTELARQRLLNLEPDFVDVGTQYTPLLSGIESPQVTRATTSSLSEPDLESHEYRSEDVVAKLFDPSSSDLCIPQSVTCDQLYLGALRDGVLALGLRPESTYCAPGFALIDVQPSLWLAGWLWGATFVDLDLAVLEQHPAMITDMAFQSVGVSVQFRDLILRSGLNVAGLWQSWWRCPAQASGTSVWQDFFSMTGVDDIWTNNLRWQPSRGGCVLFSARRKAHPHPGVWPSAGQPWTLMNPSVPDQPSVQDHGLLCLDAASEELSTTTTNLLMKSRNEHFFGKVIHSAHSGYFYPIDMMGEALAAIDDCAATSMLVVPAHGGGESIRVVLLVFTKPASDISEAELTATLRRRMVGQLGPEYLPDRIEFFSHAPQRDEAGLVDHKWCGRQYLAGALHRKSEHPIYARLSELRHRCAAQ